MGKVYFLTGSNRGIGLEIAKLLSKDPSNTVIGTARNLSKATELSNLAQERPNVKLVTLDVSSEESLDNLDPQLKSIASEGIDTFISNAAMSNTYQKTLTIERKAWIDHYLTNVVGPIEITKILKPYLDKKPTKQIIFISSGVASLSRFFPMSTGAYGQTKTALNNTVLTLSFELKDEGYTVVAVHPGIADSDMGRDAKSKMDEIQPHIGEYFRDNFITPEQSALDQYNNIFSKLTVESSGKFLSYDGSEAPY